MKTKIFFYYFKFQQNTHLTNATEKIMGTYFGLRNVEENKFPQMNK